MVEGICRCCGLRRHAGFASGRQFQQRLRCLGGQMVGQGQQRVLSRLLYVIEPFARDAIAEQLIVGPSGE